MENILLFHIGMPKTGTTALQHFLFSNDGALKKHGWCYPELSMNDKLASTKYIWRNGQNLRWIVSDEERDKVWAIIAESLKRYNVIVSDEGAWDGNFSKVLSEAKKLQHNIKVVVYLRRQDQYIEGQYNEGVKDLYVHNTIQEHLNPMPSYFDLVQYEMDDYWSRLESIAKQIGYENMIVRPYEQQQFEGSRGDIFSDFMNIILEESKLDWKEFQIPGRNNASLRGSYFEIKKILNSIEVDQRKAWNKEYVESIMQLNDKYGNSNVNKITEGFLTKQERKHILDKQQESNVRIAKEFLHREDGCLFYDTNLDIPVYEEKASPFEADMLRMYSMLFHKLQSKMEILPLVTAAKILKKNRKLAIYGLGERGKRLLDYPFYADILIDNSDEKKGKTEKKIPIIGAGDVKDWPSYFVIVTPYWCSEIEQELQDYGMRKDDDYILMNDYVDTYLLGGLLI